MKTSDILKAAKQLISTPERWTKGFYARDKEGNTVRVSYPEAVCWCAEGALFAVTSDYADARWNGYRGAVIKTFTFEQWN